MQRTIRYPDLAGGVRAVLVGKDHEPIWQTTEVNQPGKPCHVA